MSASGARLLCSRTHRLIGLCSRLPTPAAVRLPSPAALRYLHTTTAPNAGVIQRVAKWMGLPASTQFKKKDLHRGGTKLYVACTTLTDYAHFMDELQLPDTFNSWFNVTELHIWLLMNRLSREDEDGIFVRNVLVKSMWQDVEMRAKTLGNTSYSTRKDQIHELAQKFIASLYSYDEGLLGDDHVLAGAVWRVFFQRADIDLHLVELLVQYIRKQVHHLDAQDSAVILNQGLMTFLPLRGEQLDPEQVYKRLAEIWGENVKP